MQVSQNKSFCLFGVWPITPASSTNTGVAATPDIWPEGLTTTEEEIGVTGSANILDDPCFHLYTYRSMKAYFWKKEGQML